MRRLYSLPVEVAGTSYLECDITDESINITNVALCTDSENEDERLDKMNNALDLLMEQLYIENMNEIETKNLVCLDKEVVSEFGPWLCYLTAWGMHLPEYPKLDTHANGFKHFNIERLNLNQ